MLHKNLSFLDTVLAASKNTTFEDIKRFGSKVLTYAPDFSGGGGKIEKEKIGERDKNVSRICGPYQNRCFRFG